MISRAGLDRGLYINLGYVLCTFKGGGIRILLCSCWRLYMINKIVTQDVNFQAIVHSIDLLCLKTHRSITALPFAFHLTQCWLLSNCLSSRPDQRIRLYSLKEQILWGMLPQMRVSSASRGHLRD